MKTFPSKKNNLFNPKLSKVEMYESRSGMFNKDFLPLVNWIKKFKNRCKVLDVGCSSGLLLSRLKNEGFKIYGIDPNKEACSAIKKKLGNVVFNGTLETYLKKYNGKFDFIVYNHVLEHIEDVNKEISLVKKILKKDGLFMVGVPNTNNLVFFLRQKYWESLMPNEHIWHFNTSYMTKLLNKFDFKVMGKSFYNHRREDYPRKKRIFFNVLVLLNKLFKTGEAVLLITKLKYW